MSGESTTPDLVELTRQWIETDSYEEWAAFAEQWCAPDVVLDAAQDGLGPYEGLAAVLAFLKEYSPATNRSTGLRARQHPYVVNADHDGLWLNRVPTLEGCPRHENMWLAVSEKRLHISGRLVNDVCQSTPA